VIYLLDTNVISEVTKPVVNENVLAWLKNCDEDRLFLSVISLAEISRGVALMEQGKKRDEIARWLAADLPLRFEKRLIYIDEKVALEWGNLMACTKKQGKNLSVMDGFIAATVIVHEMVLVTRNVKDFAGLDIEILNPWMPVVDRF